MLLRLYFTSTRIDLLHVFLQLLESSGFSDCSDEQLHAQQSPGVQSLVNLPRPSDDLTLDVVIQILRLVFTVSRAVHRVNTAVAGNTCPGETQAVRAVVVDTCLDRAYDVRAGRVESLARTHVASDRQVSTLPYSARIEAYGEEIRDYSWRYG